MIKSTTISINLPRSRDKKDKMSIYIYEILILVCLIFQCLAIDPRYTGIIDRNTNIGRANNRVESIHGRRRIIERSQGNRESRPSMSYDRLHRGNRIQSPNLARMQDERPGAYHVAGISSRRSTLNVPTAIATRIPHAVAEQYTENGRLYNTLRRLINRNSRVGSNIETILEFESDEHVGPFVTLALENQEQNLFAEEQRI